MSGRKEPIKTISQSEYDRLLEQARQAEDARRKAEAERRAKKQLEEDLRVAKNYNKDLENRIKNIGTDLAATKKDASDTKKELIATVEKTGKALKNLSDDCNKKVADLANDVANTIDKNNRRIEQVIERNSDEIRGEIATLRNQTQTQLTKVKIAIKNLADQVGDPNKLVDMGKDYLDVALELIAKLRDSRHAMFCPGRMEDVITAAEKAENQIKIAIGNLANASNAFLTGESAFESAHKLFEDVATAETLWQSKLALALEALTSAECEIASREKLLLEDCEGKIKELDTDFWSEGALAKLKEQIGDLRAILSVKDKAQKLSFEDLDGIAKLSEIIITDSENIRTGAFLSILKSQERADLANDLATDLADKAGLTVIKKEGYESDDKRAANLVHLANGTTGFEVVITLKPTFENGISGIVAETEIINPGTSQIVATDFEATLREVMGDYGLGGHSPIPENPCKEQEIRNWEERDKALTIATITANPGIANQINEIKRTASN